MQSNTNNVMEFSPNNPIVRLCLQAMAMEGQGKVEEAKSLFLNAWNQAAQDFEKFLAAHFIARQQPNPSDKLKWLEITLEFALKMNDASVKSAFPALYTHLAQCYQALGDPSKAKINEDLAANCNDRPEDPGPFYHGTKADLGVGDLLVAGGDSNYKPELKMNHIYFTAILNGAGLAAALVKGDKPERIYLVEPTDYFENDPNVTNKKFPGNPTRSYRSLAPLKIIGEVTDWVRQTPQDVQSFRKKLDSNQGEIIN